MNQVGKLSLKKEKKKEKVRNRYDLSKHKPDRGYVPSCYDKDRSLSPFFPSEKGVGLQSIAGQLSL